MVPSPVTTLKTIRQSVQNVLLPELSSSHARTQALAMLQAIDMLMHAEAHLDDALLRQNADLHGLLSDLVRAADGPNRAADDALSALIEDVRAWLAGTGEAARTRRQLMAENEGLNGLFCRVMTLLSDGRHRADPDLRAIRARARTILSDRYGMDMTYHPVWVEQE